MERKLLLLGLLRNQETHGYQLNELINSHMGATVHFKKATVYDLLSKMTDDGWITSHEEREGNRPPRRVFKITKRGEDAFQRLLRDDLAKYRPAEIHGDISLAFLDAIPAAEALPLLRERRSSIESLTKQFQSYNGHPGSLQLVVEHQQRHLSSELEWLDEIIKRVEDGAINPKP